MLFPKIASEVSGKGSSGQVNAVKERQHGRNNGIKGVGKSKKGCFNCGREDHFARDKCGEIGHFKVKCHKNLLNEPQMKDPRRNDSVGSVRARKTVKGTNTHCIDEGAGGEQKQESHGSSSTPHFVFSWEPGQYKRKEQ